MQELQEGDLVYCDKCFARIEMGANGRTVEHYKVIASGAHRKCVGKKGTTAKPKSIKVISGGLPNSARR